MEGTCNFFTGMFLQPIMVQGPLTVEVLRPHSDTPHSVGLRWTSDQPDTETSTRKNTPLTGDRLPCLRRNSNPQTQQASGRRPTSSWCGHCKVFVLNVENFLLTFHVCGTYQNPYTHLV